MDLVVLQGLLTALGIIVGVAGLLTLLAIMEPGAAQKSSFRADVES